MDAGAKLSEISVYFVPMGEGVTCPNCFLAVGVVQSVGQCSRIRATSRTACGDTLRGVRRLGRGVPQGGYALARPYKPVMTSNTVRADVDAERWTGVGGAIAPKFGQGAYGPKRFCRVEMHLVRSNGRDISRPYERLPPLVNLP
jgi:hypothetical protein